MCIWLRMVGMRREVVVCVGDFFFLLGKSAENMLDLLGEFMSVVLSDVL